MNAQFGSDVNLFINTAKYPHKTAKSVTILGSCISYEKQNKNDSIESIRVSTIAGRMHIYINICVDDHAFSQKKKRNKNLTVIFINKRSVKKIINGMNE